MENINKNVHIKKIDTPQNSVVQATNIDKLTSIVHNLINEKQRNS